jgi:hypothetical protein
MTFILKNKLKIAFSLFTLLIFLMIYERFLCHNKGVNWGGLATFYSGMYGNHFYKFLCLDNGLNTLNLWKEGHFIENLQAFFLFISIFLIFLSSKIIKNININTNKNKNKNIYFFLIIQCVGLIFFLGEEISWGQHFFHWESPIIFTTYNNQSETNLHNMSNLLNELPRSLVLIWCSLSSLTLIIINKFYKINKFFYLIIYPSKYLLYISLLLIFFRLPDLMLDKLDLHPGHLENPRLGIFYDKISFNFLRLSELIELIFSFYFFIYAITLRDELYKNLKKKSI